MGAVMRSHKTKTCLRQACFERATGNRSEKVAHRMGLRHQHSTEQGATGCMPNTPARRVCKLVTLHTVHHLTLMPPSASSSCDANKPVLARAPMPTCRKQSGKELLGVREAA